MYWREDDDFYQEWVLRNWWTPFEAACLLKSACPPDDGTTDFEKVSLEYDLDLVNDDEQSKWHFSAKTELIRQLADVIASNNKGQTRLEPMAITQWAVSKKALEFRSSTVTAVTPFR